MYCIEASTDGLTWEQRTVPLPEAEAHAILRTLLTDQRRIAIVNLEHRAEHRPEIRTEVYRIVNHDTREVLARSEKVFAERMVGEAACACESGTPESVYQNRGEETRC